MQDPRRLALASSLTIAVLLSCSKDELEAAAKDAAAATKEHSENAVELAKDAAAATKEHSEDAVELARDAAAATKERAERAAELAKDAAAATKERAGDAVGAAKDRAAEARQWAAQNQPSGELSDESKRLLSTASNGIAETVRSGTQLAPVALKVAEAAYGSAAKDFHVEAIYQAVGAAKARRQIERQIAEMPRTELIDGTLVGFLALGGAENESSSAGKVYLVVWVQGDHLAGFVYRSDNLIEVGQLVNVMPTVLKKAKPLL